MFSDLLQKFQSIDPHFLNIEYWFYKILEIFQSIISIDIPWQQIFNFLKSLLSILIIILLIIIIYSLIRIRELKEDPNIFLRKEFTSYTFPAFQIQKKNEKWEKIVSLIQSHNPSDWKVAIIEADNMLDDLTISLGLVGDNLGERLKSAEESTFKTISYAWEAHLFRNRIVHENIAISHFDAQRIIYLFEMVFKEFNFI